MALEEEGTVLEVAGDHAVVLVISHGGCESCPSASVCGGDGEQRKVNAINPVNAKPGDRVKVVMHAQMYLKGTMIVYALPVFLLIAGAILGKYLADTRYPGVNADLMAAGIGLTLLVVSFLGAKFWSHSVEKSNKYLPVIEKVL